MEKKELKNKIDETIRLIKTNSKDVHFAEELVDKLMSLKGQYDVEPMLVSMPVTGKEEVVNPEGPYTITRNEFGVVFHVRGLDFVQRKDGRDVVIKSFNKFSHCPYDKLFELWNKKKNGTLTAEEKQDYETFLIASVALPQTPFVACVKEHWQSMLVLLLDQWFTELNSELECEIQSETPEENADFLVKNDMFNEALKGEDDVKSL